MVPWELKNFVPAEANMNIYRMCEPNAALGCPFLNFEANMDVMSFIDVDYGE